MQIHFIADSDREDFSPAIQAYQSIWKQDGEKIVAVWETTADLTFQESEINAVVFRGISHSHPMALRDNLDTERKKSVLVHELGHRLLYGRVNQPNFSSLENHKTLFLVLYDVFVALYGESFADSAVAWDKQLPRDTYEQAWEWAMRFSKEARKHEFAKRIRVAA